MNQLKSWMLLLLFTIMSSVVTSQEYTLVWQDEFTNGIGPDWVFETGNGNDGWGNQEFQYYRRENARAVNGELVITARRESFGGHNYTSARMKTQGRKSWKYGKIEARIKMPSFTGSWPAFWMLGDNITSIGWPACGEIDIMEHINDAPDIFGTIHWQDQNGNYAQYSNGTNNNVTGYHVYTIEWTDRFIKWFVDGRQFNEANIANNINGTEEFHKNQFILLNMAIGGRYPGFVVNNNAFPASMHVDWVRVYQKGGVAPPPPPTGPIAKWEAHNVPGKLIRHANSRGRIDSNVTPARAAEWRMVPGLAGRGVSFQSVNFPNRYLRHRNAQVWLDPFQNNNLFKADASFIRRPGLADGSKTSFESVNFPGRFLRHRNSLLYVEAVPNALGRADATFGSPGTGGGGGGGGSFSKVIEAESFTAMNGIQTEPCSEGGLNVGYIDAGDWMAYGNVNIPANGDYKIEYRVASAVGGGRLSSDLSAGATVLGQLDIPNTGGWQNWTTISHTVRINAGSYPFGIFAQSGGWNINWIKITSTANKSAAVDSVLSIVPNPANGFIQINGVEKIGPYVIYNVNGQKVMDGVLNSNGDSINISDLSSGLYLFKNLSSQSSVRFIKE